MAVFTSLPRFGKAMHDALMLAGLYTRQKPDKNGSMSLEFSEGKSVSLDGMFRKYIQEEATLSDCVNEAVISICNDMDEKEFDHVL